MARSAWSQVPASKRQRMRASWLRAIATGSVSCARCGGLIEPGQHWDLDHLTATEYDPEGILDESGIHPSHRRCNRRHGQAIKTAKHRRPAPRCPGCGGPLPPGADFICSGCARVVAGLS